MDTAILLWIHQHSGPGLDAVFRLSHELGTWAFGTALVVGMVLWHLSRRERPEAVAWLVLGVTTAVVPELLKAAFARPRPTLWPPLVSVSGYSFPSGHATLGAAFYPLLGWVATRSRPAKKRAAYAMGMAVGVFIGVGRLYLGVHWPSDVLAGWCLGAALSAGAVRWLSDKAEPSSGQST